MSEPKSWTHERAKVASLKRCVKNGERAADDPELTAAYQNLRAIRLEDYVRKVLAEAPRPTDEQLNRIAALLRVGGDHDTAA
jgi:hypothetical protein